MNVSRLLFERALGKRSPTVDGRLDVAELKGPVTIRRDAAGIPYVEAQHDRDAWFALGFCQGQDRAFQIEVLTRLIRGTVAALAGKDGLGMDRLSRRIGFRRIGEAQLPLMPAVVQEQLDAFARGVSCGVRRGGDKLAHEFSLFLVEPTPFDAADVLGGAAFVAFALASNWDVELARLLVLQRDGADAMAALDARYPDRLPVSGPPGALAGPAADRLAEDLARYHTFMSAASNNWALAPSRTKSGRPIVACDPHLPPVLPVHWYLAQIRTPHFAVAGANFIGQCGFSFGHNGHAAWGPTAAHHDNTDLFVERMGKDGASVKQGDGYVPCEVREEVIEVRGGKPVREKVVVTPRGPIVGPAFHDELGAVSLRATWMQKRGFHAQYQIHTAKSFSEVRRLHDPYPGTALSFVYADTDGTIGWTLVGDAPIRKKGSGTVPLPGWDPEVGWEDRTVPMAQMPHVVDPPSGFVCSANNQPVASESGAFLGVDWLDGYRQARIVESLSSRRDWDMELTRALQLDQVSLVWRDVRDVVLALPAFTEPGRRGISLLKHWDGGASALSPAATVFQLFFAEMVKRAVEAKAPRSAQIAMGQGPNMVMPQTTLAIRRVAHLVELMRAAPAGWFARPWSVEMADALDHVVRKLEVERGPRLSRWAWGKVRPLTMKHFASAIPGLGKVFDLGPVPLGGDLATLAQGAVDFKDPTGNPVGVTNMRFLVDVGRWDETRVVLAGGQSGNPLSPHYGDMFDLWKKGETTRFAWSPRAIAAATVTSLTLTPVAAVRPAPARTDPARGATVVARAQPA
jgi:penicillin amidase